MSTPTEPHGAGASHPADAMVVLDDSIPLVVDPPTAVKQRRHTTDAPPADDDPASGT